MKIRAKWAAGLAELPASEHDITVKNLHEWLASHGFNPPDPTGLRHALSRWVDRGILPEPTERGTGSAMRFRSSDLINAMSNETIEEWASDLPPSPKDVIGLASRPVEARGALDDIGQWAARGKKFF